MNKLYRFIKNNPAVFAILAVIALQNPIWVLWTIPFTEISFIFCILLFINKWKTINKKLSRILFPTLLLLAFFVFLSFFRGGGAHGSSLLYILCYMSAFCITVGESRKVLELVSKGMGFIIAISLPAWIIHQTVYQLPVFNLIDLSFMKGGGGGAGSVIMENYFFFVQNPAAGAFRFYSLFDEPGVMGTLGAYLLFHNKYDFKRWYNISLLVGCLCSMSMAFYVLTLVGFVYTRVKSVKSIISTVIASGIIVALLWNFLQASEDFNDLIVGRFFNLSDRIDRRAGDMVNAFYNNMSTDQFLLGIGFQDMVSRGLYDGASYKLFIIENGFLALLSLVYAYFKLNRKNTIRVLVFVALFWGSFLQRPTAFSGWQMLVYACIVTSIGFGECRTIQVNESNKKKMII